MTAYHLPVSLQQLAPTSQRRRSTVECRIDSVLRTMIIDIIAMFLVSIGNRSVRVAYSLNNTPKIR